jgi:two-component sensor histidine kinase
MVLLCGAVTVWPLVSRAQQQNRTRRLGVLMALAEKDAEGQKYIASFAQGLRELGWTGGLVQAANTQRLLLNELNHRVKNALANVQAVAQQTLRSTRDPADFANRFGGRVQALARAHSMLTEETWQSADLRELIYDQVLRGTIDERRLSACPAGLRGRAWPTMQSSSRDRRT